MKNKKIIYLLTVILCLTMGCFIGVNANSINEEINAILSYDVKIKYNNEYQNMYDANSNQVYPILYNGTTYVPIRAVSKIFDIPVDWDAENRTVLLGNNSEWTYLTAENVKTKSYWYNDVLNVKIGETTYKTGYKTDNKTSTYVYTGCNISVEPKYSEFSCILVSEAEKDIPIVIQVKDVDTGKVLYEKDANSNCVNEIKVNIVGCSNIKVDAKYANINKPSAGENIVYIVDAKVK